jgi:hypothetical protein
LKGDQRKFEGDSREIWEGGSNKDQRIIPKEIREDLKWEFRDETQERF